MMRLAIDSIRWRFRHRESLDLVQARVPRAAADQAAFIVRKLHYANADVKRTARRKKARKFKEARNRRLARVSPFAIPLGRDCAEAAALPRGNEATSRDRCLVRFLHLPRTFRASRSRNRRPTRPPQLAAPSAARSRPASRTLR